MASSSRRVFIGYLVLAKAAKAGGDQKTSSRPPLTAVPMIGNSGAPLEHLVHPAVCEAVSLGAESASRLGTYVFRKWGRGGRDPGASPGVPNPPPCPPQRLAARGGKGELCTALKTRRTTLLCTKTYRTIYKMPIAIKGGSGISFKDTQSTL
jgi:hypothetical protein